MHILHKGEVNTHEIETKPLRCLDDDQMILITTLDPLPIKDAEVHSLKYDYEIRYTSI